jgi:enoyl-[acyl-carrier-protein] reductase (NADH)
MEPGLAGLTMLKRAETLEDLANAAVFAVSDKARHITGSVINITGGNATS